MSNHSLIVVFTILGFLAGDRFRAAADAWSDYWATKARLPPLLAAAWKLTRVAAAVVGLAVACVGLGMYISPS